VFVKDSENLSTVHDSGKVVIVVFDFFRSTHGNNLSEVSLFDFAGLFELDFFGVGILLLSSFNNEDGFDGEVGNCLVSRLENFSELVVLSVDLDVLGKSGVAAGGSQDEQDA